MDRKRRTEKINPELGGIKKAKVTNHQKLKENTRLHYPELDDTRTNKLNKLLDEVVTKASIDYGNQEIRDIQTAVRTMLERVVTRVNERGMFKISRTEPCGSMRERTAVWKYYLNRHERYTEFDFLAVLDYYTHILCRDHGCGQCVKVSELPVSDGAMNRVQGYGDKFLSAGTRRCDYIFWRELNMCFGSCCNCFLVEYNNNNPTFPSYSYNLAEKCESDYRCDKCVVETPTGILRVNHSVSVGGSPMAANCSLAFMWTSKANTLPVYDHLLQEKARQVTSLPVHVDFLPVLEVLKAKPDEATHDYFLVPKHCNVCEYGKKDKWRKSNCMVESDYIVNDMTYEKHRKCYKIIKKYLFSIFEDKIFIHINWYYVKTVTLNHSRECSDSSEGCADCVLKILTELKRAYETKTLTSFHESDVNKFGSGLYFQPETIKCIQKAIERLCSATDIIQLLSALH